MSARLLLPAIFFAACAAPNPRAVSTDELVELEDQGVQTQPTGGDEQSQAAIPPSESANEFGGDFTLEVAMDIARANAIDVLRAADAQLAANADLRILRSSTFFPTLVVGASAGRVTGVVQSTDGSLLSDIDKENAYLGISVRWDVDLATAIHGVDAARQTARAATWDWIVAELVAETAAALLYYDLLEARARVEIAEAAVDSATAYHLLTEARFQAGAGLEIDVLRAFAHLAEVRQQHVEALAARGTSSTLIAELLGLDPLRPLDPSDVLEPHDLVDNVTEFDLVSHPVLEAARAHLAAAKASANEQRSRWFLPELILDAGYNDFGVEFGELDDQDTVMAAFSWDLSPSLFSRSERAHADLLRAEHDAEAEHRRVQSELVRAQIAVLAADDLIETTLTRVEASRAAVGLEQVRHEEGDALLIELLDAEISLRRAETAHAVAVCTHNRAQHLLHQSLGG